jgi:trans-aconitate 2-methyltransferase
MERICEAELMDDLAQAEAYGAADFSSSDRDLVEWIDQQFPGGLGENLVDLGCGPGNITFLLAEKYPEARVLGLDGALAMLGLAEERRLSEQVRFQEALLPSTELEGGHTAVISNSLLHHLHDPQVLWQSVRQLGAPGAVVVIHDLRRPSNETEQEALVERYAAGAPPILRRDYSHSLRAAFTLQEVREQLALAGLSELQLAERDDRYLVVWGRLTA